MKNNFAKRKKKFWALCLVLAMVLVQVVPTDVKATEYTFTGSAESDPSISRLKPGDILYYKPGKYSVVIEVFYYGEDGRTNSSGEANSPLSVKGDFSPVTIYTFSEAIKEFSASGIDPGNPDAFKEWKVEDIYYGSNGFLIVDLDAVFYTESSITYELNGGTNNSQNPAVYYEGKETVSLKDATKKGYDFVGWYSDSAYTKEVTEIPTTKTGPITLYAKYTPATYGITYKLDGGSNGSGNPTSYTYEKGVKSFADASKAGYDFEGWYSDAGFKTKVTSISATETGNKTLYAKFSGKNYTIKYDLDGGSNGAGNPTSYTCGKGVTSFANASKAGYDFEGWYRDAEFTKKVTSISTAEKKNITLYAKFTPKTYEITYDLDGGDNGAGNPADYTYGEGVTSLADADKEGYTFEGWYSDAEFTTKVTSISATEMGPITLYAKFKKILIAGEGTITVDDVYYGEEIHPVVKSATNGTENVTIEYKTKGEADNSYTVTKPVSAGAYTARATFAKTEDYKEVIATDEFSILKKQGTGSIFVADVGYGALPVPVVKSATNGMDHVTIQYKQKDAADNTYTDVKPNAIGDYTARAVFAETEGYLQVIATDDFSIGYLAVQELPYQIKGTKGENDFYTSAVTIVPADGFLISDSLTGTFREQIALSTTTEKFSVYLKKADTGEITSAIDVPEIKIDKDAPVISGAQSGETIYGDEVKMEVKDENLSQILVNGETVKFENGQATLNLSSNQGEEKYEIVAVDRAGNKSSKQVVVSAEWMKSKVIPEGKTVRLHKNCSYTLGGGKWKISGDSTTYSGNTIFYVNSEGDYSFSQVN